MMNGTVEFSEPWLTVKYDAEGSFHRTHIEKCQGIKGIDYLATTGKHVVWLEETNFRANTLADRHSLNPGYKDDLLNSVKLCKEKSTALPECSRLNELKWMPQKMYIGDEFIEKLCGTLFGLSIAAYRNDFPELQPYISSLQNRIPITAILCILHPPSQEEFGALAGSLETKIKRQITSKIHKGLGFNNFGVMVVNHDSLPGVLNRLHLSTEQERR
jgi:hypothetical protein